VSKTFHVEDVLAVTRDCFELRPVNVTSCATAESSAD
jgi:hypothetical protein